jgi:sugar/nucleoside kinase (ribokinase family)
MNLARHSVIERFKVDGHEHATNVGIRDPTTRRYRQIDVIGLGIPVVDELANVNDDFLKAHGFRKGHAELCTDIELEQLASELPARVRRFGGSVCNTLVGIASLGGIAAFIGKVASDELGEVFIDDLNRTGVRFALSPAPPLPRTGHAIVLVTPDGERTPMVSYGAGAWLSTRDIPTSLVRIANTIYIQGNLLDTREPRAVVDEALRLAALFEQQRALSIGSAACAARHRERLRNLLDRVDIVFMARAEACTLFETPDWRMAAARILGRCRHVVITLGAEGSIIMTEEEIREFPPWPVERIVDTTGAGDAYAAGILYSLSRGYEMEKCALLASLAAAEVVQHIGARPEASLKDIIVDAGLTDF